MSKLNFSNITEAYNIPSVNIKETNDKIAELTKKISESAAMMGLPPNVDMNVIFNNMSKLLDIMKKQIDKTGSDL